MFDRSRLVLAGLALLLVTLLWGTTFPAMKAVSLHMPPGLMVGSRWLLAALVFAPWVEWRSKALWRDALIVTTLLFASFVLQVIGLTMMSAGRNAFITGFNIILVPLLMPLLGSRLPVRALVAAALATGGIVVMSYEQSSGWLGDALTLGCAVAFALYIIGMSRYAPRHATLAFAGAQAVIMALFSPLWIAGEWLWWGAAYPEMAAGISGVWLELIYLGLVCSGFALILQTWAQARASATQAAIIYALEPFFAALFATWWLGETFGPRAMIGGVLIVVAMVYSQLPDKSPATA
ncbi:DMT family transporter [Uliginosibacterium gangwonense]|uniref:DMT family transporter n=1 Tax=Uliginosibacterium gangwonense TaxID=392736 RepID=UPI00036EA5FD|nr:DMT family transporter [Uliginosibacterium gangwonense]